MDNLQADEILREMMFRRLSEVLSHTRIFDGRRKMRRTLRAIAKILENAVQEYYGQKVNKP